jgi:hypothetical protein
VGVLLGLWGCGLGTQAPGVTPAPAPAASEASVADAETEAATTAIHDSLDSYQKVEGRLQNERYDSEFVAYFEDERLRYLVERVDLGADSSEINEYYFENARLFYFTQNRRVALVTAERRVNEAPVEVSADDILAVRLHVDQLEIAATETRLRSRHAGNGSSGSASTFRPN